MSSTRPKIEGETARWTHPSSPGRDRRFDRVSRIVMGMAKQPTHGCLNRRTVTEIQKKVVKQGKRNVVLRFILTKSDKEKIAAWKQDLLRVLQVFNVCSVGPVGIRKPNGPLADRAGNRYQHRGCGHSRGGFRHSCGGYGHSDDGCRYAPKHAGRTGGYLRSRAFSTCDLSSPNP